MRSPSSRPELPLARGLLFASIALLFLTLSVQEIRSADFWWQLATGRWIVENGRLPGHDVFTYTVPGTEWIEVRWLFYVFTYLGWTVGGPALLILAQAALLAAAFVALVRPSWRVARTLPGAAIVVLGIWAASGRFVVRPEIVTFALTSAFLVVLDGYRRGRFRRLVWALPAAQVLWSNAHTVFILGPVLAWLFVAGETISRAVRRPDGNPRGATPGPARLATIAAAITAACLLNPHGPKGAIFPFLLFREIHASSIVGRAVQELQSPFVLDRWGWDLRAAAILFAVSGLSFVACRSRLNFARLAIWASVSYLAGQSVRNVALFAFVGTWTALRNLEDTESPGTDRRDLAQWIPKAGVAWATLALAFAVGSCAWYVASDRYAVRFDPDRRFGLGIAPWYQAEAATSFLMQSGARPQLFHEMADGSYLIWAARGRFPVFIDGRNEVFGEPFIAEYLATAAGRRDFDRFADRWGIRSVMLGRGDLARLADVLLQSPRWVLVHLDSRELVFLRDLPEHAEVIRRYRIDPGAGFTPRGPEPDEMPAGWRRWFGSVGRPWYSLGIARSLLLVGAVESAMPYLERAHHRFPEDREVRLVLAQVYRSLGRKAEADRLVAGVTVSAEEESRSDEMLAGLALSRGRPAEAAAALERALRARPDDPLLQARLGRALLESKDYPRAAAAFRAALALTPAAAQEWVGLGHALALAGDTGGALDAYGNALRHDPALYQVHHNMGVLLGRRGDSAGAREHFRAAIRIKPDYDAARQALERIGSTGP